MNKITFESAPMNRDLSEEFGHLNFLYQNIEPSDYQFELLNRGSLSHVSAGDYMVCLNATKKSRFFLVLNSFNSINQAVFIAYARHCSSSQVWAVHLQADENLFKGTILDGELIQTNLGELAFLISDVYLAHGESMSNYGIKERRAKFDINSLIYNKYLSKLTFQWNPIYECAEISTALKHEDNFDFDGIMFIPRKPGQRWIFRIDQQESSQQTKRPESAPGEQIVFSIEQTDLPDVYPIAHNKIDYGHLYIPNKTISLKVRKWVIDNTSVNVLCEYNGKKWIPISLMKNKC